MFEAYSTKNREIVSVQTQFDLSEIFSCPNPSCTAKFKIKSASGKRKKHFARLKTTEHSDTCPYKDAKSDYVNKDDLMKFPIEEIYSYTKSSKSTDREILHQRESTNSSKVRQVFVRTPKQLYYFCVSNALNTAFYDNLLVKDIVLDYRNLFYEKNFLGISGLRLVVAKTHKFYIQGNKNIVELRLERVTQNGKPICLTIVLEMEYHLFQNLKRHILQTNNNRFAGYTVAVFENWETTKKFYIKGIIQSDKHLMFK